MGTTGTLYFTGLSTYSSDFQQIIARSVAIAQQPVTALQTQVSLNTNKNASLQALNPGVAALGASVTALGALASTRGLAASSSDSSVVSVVNAGASVPGTYKISDITSLASAASETSLVGYTDTQAVSSSGFVNLVVGSRTYSLDLTGADQNNVQGLADAINSSGSGAGASVFTSGSTNYLVLTANNSGATTLQLNDVSTTDLVSNTGTGTETSISTYPDATTAPVSATGQVMLTVGSNTYNLDVSANNNLTGLANAINNSGAGITATVTGIPAVPGFPGSFSLSLVHAGATSIQLNDLQTPASLVSNTNQGTDASYKLNGVSETSSSNNIAGVISGVSFTLKNLSVGAVTLSLASNGSQLSNTLQGLVTSYNALVTQVQAQQGPSAGPLGGDLLINEIAGDMQQLVTYYNPNSSSSVRSLSDLGITFDYSGKLSFDPTAMNGLTDTQITDAYNFLGSSSTGLGALARNFTQLSDPVSGLIQAEEAGLNRTNTHLTSKIATLNQSVAQIQAQATKQAQQADALVAALQSQQATVNASIQGLNYVLYGKTTGANGL